MSVYDKTGTAALKQIETHLYGSSRLGIAGELTVASLPVTLTGGFSAATVSTFTRGEKFFEMSNHLGNVLVTISDKKIQHTTNSTVVDYWNADVVTATDYAPFGMQLVGRKFSGSSSYRYGFNGKENDLETNTQDYGMRIYDPRLGRFISVDPITDEYPELTPYQFASNTPIQATDLDGLEADFSAAKADKMEYQDDDKWYDKVGKFVGNTGISLWNGVVGTAETGVNMTPGYLPGNKKVFIDDNVSLTKDVYDWTANTSGSQKWQDIKDVATNPHTYEDIAAIIITRKVTKALGPKTKPSDAHSVDPNWKAKIEGKAQKTGTPGHQVASYRKAITEAKDPSVKKVYLNKGINKVAGLPSKTIQPNIRPDVSSVKKNGPINTTEIQSRTDNPATLRGRNIQAQQKLPSNQRGSVTVTKPTTNP
jgi:RHS repeat-associated protein